MLMGGVAYRLPNAYPVLDVHWEESVAAINRYLERFSNLWLTGGSGRFVYGWIHNMMRFGVETVDQIRIFWITSEVIERQECYGADRLEFSIGGWSVQEPQPHDCGDRPNDHEQGRRNQPHGFPFAIEPHHRNRVVRSDRAQVVAEVRGRLKSCLGTLLEASAERTLELDRKHHATCRG